MKYLYIMKYNNQRINFSLIKVLIFVLLSAGRLFNCFNERRTTSDLTVYDRFAIDFT